MLLRFIHSILYNRLGNTWTSTFKIRLVSRSVLGYHQVGNQGANNKIDGRCNGVQNGEYALGGTSISGFNPSGWANIKLDLSNYGGNYIELRFVLEYNDVAAGSGYTIYNTTSMPGWYIDNFRFGSTLPQSGDGRSRYTTERSGW